MAHLYKKHLNGRTYWYIRETQRVGRKVRVKWQYYLGTPETIVERLERAKAAERPLRVAASSYGAVFVAHVLEQRLDTIGLIDSIVPRDPREVGPSVGEYFFYAWANRLIDPKSKRGLETWYRQTAIEQLRTVDLSALTSQRYWEKWERVSSDAIEKIGQAFFKKVWEGQALPPECVMFDTTNYYTYMASERPSSLAQRGHNKAGKHHLRQIGVALLVDRQSELALHYREYAGNTHDSKVFHEVVDEMFGTLCGFNQTKQRLTVVFDKGMNSEENIAAFDSNPRVHFITNYSPYFAEDLASVPLASFSPLALRRNEELEARESADDRMLAYRAKRVLWGQERTVVVTYNPVTARKQGYAFERKLLTLRTALLEFRSNYRNALPHWRKSDDITRRYERLCAELHIGVQYYRLEFGDRRCAPEMSFRKDDYQVQKAAALHGRNIIVTDNHDWSTEDIVQLSLDRYVVEKQFRASKSRDHVNLNPFFHWTDSKIRCHILSCVIALTALRLFELELERHNVRTDNGEHSARAVLEQMHALHSVILWHHQRSKPTIQIEEPNRLQKAALKALGFDFQDGSVLQLQ